MAKATLPQDNTDSCFLLVRLIWISNFIMHHVEVSTQGVTLRLRRVRPKNK